MNLFVKFTINDATHEKIKALVAETFPGVDFDAIVSDGTIFPLDVDEQLTKMGLPIELLMPILQMVGSFFKGRNEQEDSSDTQLYSVPSTQPEPELYYIRNMTTGMYLFCNETPDNFGFTTVKRNADLYVYTAALKIIELCKEDFPTSEFEAHLSTASE